MFWKANFSHSISAKPGELCSRCLLPAFVMHTEKIKTTPKERQWNNSVIKMQNCWTRNDMIFNGNSCASYNGFISRYWSVVWLTSFTCTLHKSHIASGRARCCHKEKMCGNFHAFSQFFFQCHRFCSLFARVECTTFIFSMSHLLANELSEFFQWTRKVEDKQKKVFVVFNVSERMKHNTEKQFMGFLLAARSQYALREYCQYLRSEKWRVHEIETHFYVPHERNIHTHNNRKEFFF